MSEHIELGSKVRCKVTGVVGIATSRITYLNGCDRIEVQPQYNEEKKEMPKGYCFDEPQLEVVEGPKYRGETAGPSIPSIQRTGGPMSDSPSKMEEV